MTSNLLDYEEQERPKSNIFSKIALGFGGAALLGLSYFFFAPMTITASESLEHHPRLIFLSFVFLLLGFITSVICIIRKERWKYFKRFAIFINFGLLLFVICGVKYMIDNGFLGGQ